MTKPGAKRTARDRYGQHRESARIRNIPFLLTFEEWYDLWMVIRDGKRTWAHPGDSDYPKQESNPC